MYEKLVLSVTAFTAVIVQEFCLLFTYIAWLPVGEYAARGLEQAIGIPITKTRSPA